MSVGTVGTTAGEFGVGRGADGIGVEFLVTMLLVMRSLLLWFVGHCGGYFG